jgi:DNA adenine methylase
MILKRIGNKARIAHKIIQYFPPHETYVEPFFGGGGMFFNKPKAKYNIVNDLDSEVFNLYQVLLADPIGLKREIELMPYHEDLLRYWKANKETDPMRKALRFLFLSNYTFYGKGETLRVTNQTNVKALAAKRVEATYRFLSDVQFLNKDFRDFLKSFTIHDNNCSKIFIYCDPPYIGTDNNYSNGFTEQDTIDLFDCLAETGCKYAVSEFDNDFVLQLARQRKLNVIYIGERQNLGNRRTEILITNYYQQKTLF